MCLKLFGKKSEFQGKYIYWDTNCYRILGRNAIQRGLPWLDSFLKKLKRSEKRKSVQVKASYIVLAEMFSHLDEDIDSGTYLECKNGLFSALYHTGFNQENLLFAADTEFTKFIAVEPAASLTTRDQSLYNLLLSFKEKGFTDSIIKENLHNVIKMKSYLARIKDSWKSSFVNYFIKKHDSSYAGNFQVFMDDLGKRTDLLSELRSAKESGQIYNDFGVGIYEYIQNNKPTLLMKPLDIDFFRQIINRFKPVFDLQYRILELFCQNGYNLNKKGNDVTDYLILANLEAGKSIFVSNETRNLLPALKNLGYSKDILSSDDYFNKLSIDL